MPAWPSVGITQISAIEHIECGYEDFISKLKMLGANIKLIDNALLTNTVNYLAVILKKCSAVKLEYKEHHQIMKNIYPLTLYNAWQNIQCVLSLLWSVF